MITTLLAARPVPTTADWLTAWTTLGAFLAAGVAAFAAWRGLKATRQALDDERATRQQEVMRLNAEAAEREADRRDAEARQARLISAESVQVAGPERVYQLTFVVHNDSAGPILDVIGRSFQHVPDRPETVESAPAAVYPIRRIGPGGSEQLKFVPLDRERYLFPGRSRKEPWPSYEVDLEFTDAAGLRWRRRGTAQPVRVLAPFQDQQR